MAWIALIAGPHLVYWHMAAPLILAGAGVAMASPATQSSVLSSVAPQYIGKASGAFSTMRQLGGAFGVAVLVVVFGRAGSYASAQAFSDGFVPAIGAGRALTHRRDRRHRTAQLAQRDRRCPPASPNGD